MAAANKIKNTCILLTAFLVVGSNAFNYFVSYKMLDDLEMEWRVAMISIAFTLFVMSVYMWVTSKWKVLTGWMSLYLFFNLIGVLIGYDLHTKGFVPMLLTVAFFGTCHVIVKIWRN